MRLPFRVLDGWARKASIPVVLLTIPGWFIFVIGFALFNSESEAYDALNEYEDERISDLYPDQDHRADKDWFPHWCFIVTGPVFFFSAIVHLFIGQWYTGLFHHFLVVLYLASGGGAMYRDGGEVLSKSPAAMNRVYDVIASGDISRAEFQEEGDYGQFMFMGAIGALLSEFFVTAYMVLWAFYSDASRPRDQVIASGNQWEMDTK